MGLIGSTCTALPWRTARAPRCRGLHLLTSQLNLSALYGIGGARRGCVARVKGGIRGCLGCVGCFCVSDTAQVELGSERVCAPASLLIIRTSSSLFMIFLMRASGRGLHSSTSHLNLSRVCRKKTPCTPNTPYHPLHTGYTTPARTRYAIQSAQVELKSGRV